MWLCPGFMYSVNDSNVSVGCDFAEPSATSPHMSMQLHEAIVVCCPVYQLYWPIASWLLSNCICWDELTSQTTGTFYILWPSDAIWWHRSGSASAQVMACCLTAPSYYLNQCWFIIIEDQWHTHLRAFSQEIPKSSITKINLKITCQKFHSDPPGSNELKFFLVWYEALVLSWR